jgi:hypothetical protein
VRAEFSNYCERRRAAGLPTAAFSQRTVMLDSTTVASVRAVSKESATVAFVELELRRRTRGRQHQERWKQLLSSANRASRVQRLLRATLGRGRFDVRRFSNVRPLLIQQTLRVPWPFQETLRLSPSLEVGRCDARRHRRSEERLVPACIPGKVAQSIAQPRTAFRSVTLAHRLAVWNTRPDTSFPEVCRRLKGCLCLPVSDPVYRATSL